MRTDTTWHTTAHSSRIVLAVFWHAKDWRLLFHPAHFVGLAIMLAIPGAWAIPFLQRTTTDVALDKWSAQFTGRLRGIDFKFVSWIQNIPRSLVYFLPWIFLFPFARFSRFQDQAQQRFARALAWGIAAPFVAVNLVPGAVARYSMPVITPACWLLAMTYVGNALQWPRNWTRSDRDWARVVATFVALGIAIGAIGYPLTAVVLKNRQQVKKAAAEINALVPGNEAIYAVNPDYQPVFFYLKSPVKYVSHVSKLPADGRYVLLPAGKETEAAMTSKWAPLQARPLARVRDYSNRELVLFKVGP